MGTHRRKGGCLEALPLAVLLTIKAMFLMAWRARRPSS